MSPRTIQGLKWARQLAARPTCIPKVRARGAKAEGLRYERLVAKRLPFALHGQWFEYEDLKGHGYCQPDLLMEIQGHQCILEVKYTWTAEGHYQLERLYRPVVEMALASPTVGVVVCKRLEEQMPGTSVTGDLWHALQLARQGGRPVFHWLGRSTITSPRLIDLNLAA